MTRRHHTSKSGASGLVLVVTSLGCSLTSGTGSPPRPKQSSR